MIARDCKPIGHVPPLPRIDLNAPRPRARASMPNPFYDPFKEAMAQSRLKAEQDRIWKLIEQVSQGA